MKNPISITDKNDNTIRSFYVPNPYLTQYADNKAVVSTIRNGILAILVILIVSFAILSIGFYRQGQKINATTQAIHEVKQLQEVNNNLTEELILLQSEMLYIMERRPILPRQRAFPQQNYYYEDYQ